MLALPPCSSREGEGRPRGRKGSDGKEQGSLLGVEALAWPENFATHPGSRNISNTPWTSPLWELLLLQYIPETHS